MTEPSFKHKQRGAATIVVAAILLIAITIVTLFTARTVLVETELTADHNRTTQAVTAANYAMDYGVSYFDSYGFDQDADGNVDTVTPPNIDVNTTYGPLTLSSQVEYDTSAGTVCVDAGETPTLSKGMLVATGFSDDGLARRTITQCVGPISLLADEGPDMPLISRSEVALTGTANIVNRYTNINIWSGDKVTIGSSSSMSTFIKSNAAGNLSLPDLLNADPDINTQIVSSNNLGNGLDIIDDDPSLDTATAADFFSTFFNTDDPGAIEDLASNIGQNYNDMSLADGKDGLIWIEGDQNFSGGDIGTIDNPAIVIVNGDLQFTGNASIHGLLYVKGEMRVGGTVDVVGTSIVEGDGVPTGDSAVYGNGTLNLIYWKDFLAGASAPLPGLTAVVSGSWRDW
ncbi:hypothetical protein [Methylophaga sp.]|uniref:hypothetical protein n=1 Tax=Methylophaga sp. TaxID=2024840 RepID=UPI0014015A42|nr:hypothetical protein [Methylophaga sp.]MTI64276.1 hypothetical protein [Methylophaga sp.]